MTAGCRGILHRLEHGAFALNCSQGDRNRPPSAFAADVDASGL
jgi:hypothetical protein